ncbi:MAG: DNA cytosine methyltransferase [Bacteroidales bacterium]|nr:DNA cytosine methyltransferase [Bacteroidales bacterium]
MNHGSLFTGLGGFDLAAQWMGWNNVFQCEIDSFCQKVLKYHFPNTKLHHDIKETDFSQYKGAIDVVSGGLPCQPFSVAGKRKGSSDDRYLWDEMLRAICQIFPRYIVVENVRGLVSGQQGMVFERMLTDLETIGYQTQSFIIPAASVGSVHKRERIWIVAHADSDRSRGLRNKNKKTRTPKGDELLAKQCAIPNWDNFPTQSPVCCGDDGISDRLDGITFPKWRNESIKGYGNAVVPQIPYRIFSAINDYENSQNNNHKN